MDDPTYSVSELASAIANQLARVFPDDVWVTGEVSSLSRSRTGHVYFDLIEPPAQPGQPAPARLSVVLWNTNKTIVNRQLKRAGVGKITDGMQLRLRAVVDFYEQGGRLQLRMTGADPTYTLSQMALEREQLRTRLAAEGLFERNMLTLMPPVPHRIGLITSHDSAAHADFMSEMELSGMAWQIVTADARVQGRHAERTLVAAMAALATHRVELICVVRGGGSRGDLAVFDSEEVVRAIAALDVPVLTGIGHEVDVSLADDAAHTPHKTPTACAQAVVHLARVRHDAGVASWHAIRRRTDELFDAAAMDLRTRAHRHERATASTLAVQQQRLAGATERLVRDARRAAAGAQTELQDRAALVGDRSRRGIGRTQRMLGERADRLRREAPRHVDHADRALEIRAQHVSLLDPVRTMARGWSITRRSNGTIVRSSAAIDAGEELVTQVADGRISSRVLDVTTSDFAGDDA